jgi:ABC-type Fe3+/spermidine/putrescine transport system ATPase subunit
VSSIVELEQVAMRLGSAEIFREISLAVSSGERFALLGPSGCGKSTLLRLIAGLDAPTEGVIRIGGCEASKAGNILLAPHERSLALVFQDLALWPNLSVRENVELGLAGMRLPGRQRRERAESALATCRIADLAKRRPEQLSGGQQQRAALARALAVQPKILLLDEPFTSLDIATKNHLCTEISRLCGELDLTLILVSHDPLEAIALCSRAAVLEDRRLKEIGPLQTLLGNPVSDTLRSFLAQLTSTHAISRA